MAAFKEARVSQLRRGSTDLLEATVQIDEEEVDAVGFPTMLGPLQVGNRVVVNTTGIDLGLGTGGVAFILWNLDGPPPEPHLEGHIVKLRYTPWQMNVRAVEAPESESHEVLTAATSLEGAPVVACALHSQVPAAAAGVKAARPQARVGYLMTDGGALALSFSRLVRGSQEAGLLDSTCTVGHAFGGDLEAVNVFSGLLALKAVARCDVIVAGVGPGIVGTATPYGHTGMEVGQVLDASTALGGTSVAALRLSYDDERPRHSGLSHHSVSALTIAARERARVAVPKLDPQRSRALAKQLSDSGICDRHDVQTADGRTGVKLLRARDLDPASMGRRLSQAPELWLAAAAAGSVAADLLPGPGIGSGA
jgi:hypothetical protein